MKPPKNSSTDLVLLGAFAGAFGGLLQTTFLWRGLTGLAIILLAAIGFLVGSVVGFVGRKSGAKAFIFLISILIGRAIPFCAISIWVLLSPSD
jgi:hypothetical protein